MVNTSHTTFTGNIFGHQKRCPTYRRSAWLRFLRKKPGPSAIRLRSAVYLSHDLVFWAALATCLILPHIPGGRLALWPFSLLGIYAHELFHGIAAMVTGGWFQKMVIYPYLGGSAYVSTTGKTASAFVSAGGLVGPVLVGAIILILSRRFHLSGFALFAFSASLIFSGFYWGADAFTQFFCFTVGAIIAAIALIPIDLLRNSLAQIIGIQLCIENINDFDYMFTAHFTRGGEVLLSDTASIGANIGGSYLLWGTLIAAFTIIILIVAYTSSKPG